MPALQKSVPVKLSRRGDSKHSDFTSNIASSYYESVTPALIPGAPSWHDKIEQMGNPSLKREGILFSKQKEENSLMEYGASELEKQRCIEERSKNSISFGLHSQAKDNKSYKKGIRQHLIQVTKKGNEASMQMQSSQTMQEESKSSCRAGKNMLEQVKNTFGLVEPYKVPNIFQNNVAPNQSNIAKQSTMTPNTFQQPQQNEMKINPPASNHQQYPCHPNQMQQMQHPMQQMPLCNAPYQQVQMTHCQHPFQPPRINFQGPVYPQTQAAMNNFQQSSLLRSYTPQEEKMYQKVKDLTFGQFLEQMSQNLSDLYGKIDILSDLFSGDEGFVHQTRVLIAAQKECQTLSSDNLNQSLNKLDTQLDNLSHSLDLINDDIGPLAATHVLSRYFDILTETEREVKRSSRGATLETGSVETTLEKLRSVAVEVELEYELMETQVNLLEE